jgi:hypothetical protein
MRIVKAIVTHSRPHGPEAVDNIVVPLANLSHDYMWVRLDTLTTTRTFAEKSPSAQGYSNPRKASNFQDSQQALCGRRFNRVMHPNKMCWHLHCRSNMKYKGPQAGHVERG